MKRLLENHYHLVILMYDSDTETVVATSILRHYENFSMLRIYHPPTCNAIGMR